MTNFRRRVGRLEKAGRSGGGIIVIKGLPSETMEQGMARTPEVQKLPDDSVVVFIASFDHARIGSRILADEYC